MARLISYFYDDKALGISLVPTAVTVGYPIGVQTAEEVGPVAQP